MRKNGNKWNCIKVWVGGKGECERRADVAEGMLLANTGIAALVILNIRRPVKPIIKISQI